MNILGVSLGHDTSFAKIEDGQIYGILEAERFFRKKRYKLHCLELNHGPQISGYQHVDTAELELFLDMVAKEFGKEFDCLAVQNQGRMNEFENLKIILSRHGFKFQKDFSVNHHLSHASLAFYTSPFTEALIFSYDGSGNDGTTIIFGADHNGIRYIENFPIRFGQNYNNLGYIIGVTPDRSGTGAGKTMGLASYGTIRPAWLPLARKYIRQYQKLPPRTPGILNEYGKEHRINSIGLDEITELQKFTKDFAYPRGLLHRLKLALSKTKPERELRLPSVETKEAQDLATTVQAAWSEAVLDLLKKHSTLSKNLCLVGGCALNGITNFAVENSGYFDRVHFVPNPSDCGLSAGAGLYAFYQERGTNHFQGHNRYLTPYLGSLPFDIDQLPDFKKTYSHREIEPRQVPAIIAKLIHSGLIIGVIRGRYEIGPRALGNRSILCDPLNPQMREILNQKVKHREWYRPFAPVVTAEDSQKYFTNQNDIPYMSVICHTRPQFAGKLPSVTHIDGTARVQTIRYEQNPYLHNTLKEFEKLSGFPILLNTSFNPAGEPIINFCEVGLNMLKTTNLDLVLIENTLFARQGKENLLVF